MLHFKNLHKLFFENFPNQADQFIALSGFVGPNPIKSISGLGIDSKIIFGLEKEANTPSLHNTLTGLHNQTCQILYPDTASHSKCYLWLANNKPLRGLIGSANFSSNGLYNDYRETLYEVGYTDLPVLKAYIDIIESSARKCIDGNIPKTGISAQNTDQCLLVLYNPADGEVQPSHGLNWGFSPNGNVRKGDACIPIRVKIIRENPHLFSPITNSSKRTRGSKHEVIDVIWDDGTIMQGKLEGSQPVDGVKYPKQFSSFPHKDILGKYLRHRLGLLEDAIVKRSDLVKYGRDNIEVTRLDIGTYKFDFSARS